MEIREAVRLPSGRFVTRVSVAMALRSIWHTLNGSKRRRDQEWKAVMQKAEADRKRRSAAGRKSWETRKRNAEIARALDAYDATITATTTDSPNGTTTTYAHPEGITLTSDIEGAPV